MSILDPNTEIGIDLSSWDRSKTIRIPLLRQYFPKLIAKELVSVQPMGKPSYWEPYDFVSPIEQEFFKEEEFNIE